jgi:hypothetical protein
MQLTRVSERKDAGREIQDCNAMVRSMLAKDNRHKKARVSAGFFVFDVAAPEGFEPPNA